MTHRMIGRVEVIDGQTEIVIENRNAAGRIRFAVELGDLKQGDSVYITIDDHEESREAAARMPT